MSVSRNRISYCNDCANGKASPWKIVDISKVDVIKRRCEHEREIECGCKHKEKNPCVPDDCSKTNPQLTIVSAVNPTSILDIPNTDTVYSVPNSIVVLSGWHLTTPDMLASFDPESGIFTAPENGDYEINLVVGFKASTPITALDDLSNVPQIEIVDVATGHHIIRGGIASFPTSSSVVTTSIPILPPITVTVTVTSVLAIGQVVLNIIAALSAGQQIQVVANSNGLTYTPPDIIPPPTATFSFDQGSSLIIRKVRNIPKVIYSLC